MPRQPHTVAVLALPTVVPFDLAVPVQVFGYPRPDLGRRRYALTVCGQRRGSVQTSGGFAIRVTHGLEALARAQTIVIPGVDDPALPIAPAVLAALRRAHRRGARLVAVCTGAFVLGEAGLLDRRRATTHWMDVPAFIRRFPGVAVDPDVLYVDEGRILTSAGICAGLDLCLHVVRLDHGAEVANAVARRLVVPPHRSGGQAQFIPAPVAAREGRALEGTRAWALERLATPLTVAAMARHAGMSTRSFARHFHAETGSSPLRWLLTQRVHAAQEMLERTDLPIARIAEACGFGSAVSLRVHFRRSVRTSPLAYRRTFRAQSGDPPVARSVGATRRSRAPRRASPSGRASG